MNYILQNDVFDSLVDRGSELISTFAYKSAERTEATLGGYHLYKLAEKHRLDGRIPTDEIASPDSLLDLVYGELLP